jgi:hypothetical protein
MENAAEKVSPEEPNPFVGLPLEDDSYVIHSTPRVEYLIKNMQFKRQTRYNLLDHQFSLTGRLLPEQSEKEDDDAPFHGNVFARRLHAHIL